MILFSTVYQCSVWFYLYKIIFHIMNLQQIGKYWYLQYNLYLFFLMTKINTTYLPMMLFFWEKSLTVKLESACFLYYCRSWLRIPQILRETERNLQKSIPFTTNKNRHRKDNRSYPTIGGAGNDKNNTYWNTKQSAMAKKKKNDTFYFVFNHKQIWF